MGRSTAILAVAGVLLTGVLPMEVPSASATPAEGIHNIKHVVMIMQENRSFDSYFGTYPGANGIPLVTCVPDPLNGGCVSPFHDPNDENFGGPHGMAAAVADIDGGSMDGFVDEAERGMKCSSTEPACSPCNVSQAQGSCIDAMGYHDAREIPNYWSYAQNYVLQDDMFESAASWSLPEHLFLVSGWSASCPDGDSDPLDCTNELEGGHNPDRDPNATFAWTDITYLLHMDGVSWRYYVFAGDEPDCESDEAVTCAPISQGPKTPGIWNPLADFTDVKEDGQQEDIQSLNSFYEAVHAQPTCGLPSVAWISPNSKVSEHPPALISRGQTYVTTLINAIMRSPCWDSTAIFLSWDDWGGFYDHMMPPQIDENGYGLRVPGLVISPYAKAGYIDHQQLSHDAYLKFIEDDFLSEERLHPATDGRADRRPDVREEASGLGNLESDFNFDQPPRPPLILPTDPAPGPASNPPGYVAPAPQLQPTGGESTAPAASAPAASAPPPAQPTASQGLALQLAVAVARREDLRLRHDQVTLIAGCDQECSILAHGHLSLTRDGHPLKLRSASARLAGGRSRRFALAISARDLADVSRALRAGRSVQARIALDVSGPDGARRTYLVSVELSYR